MLQLVLCVDRVLCLINLANLEQLLLDDGRVFMGTSVGDLRR